MGEGVIYLLKIIFTVLFAPIVYASAVNFYEHMHVYQANGEFFKWGIYAFLLVYLFLYRFEKMYQAGQSGMTQIFSFLAPLNQSLARIVPVYTTIILVALLVWNKFRDVSAYSHYFLFFAGFFFMMHILLLARELQDEESSLVKPSYLFQMSIYFVCILSLGVLLLDLTVWQFTFFDFWANLLTDARNIYQAAIEKVF